MSIGRRIRELRGHFSRKEFAEKLDIHQQSIYMYEKEKRIPEREIIEKICNKLKINVGWLMNGEGPLSQDAPDMPPAALGSTETGLVTCCARCARLEAELEEERRERRELAVENRKLWKENGDLREKNALFRLRQQYAGSAPFGEKPANIPCNEEHS